MVKSYSSEDIQNMDHRKRALFINSLSGFKSANLIGTRTEKNVDNLAIFSSVFHLGANPPLLGMISRPDSVHRGTLANIEKVGFYTINHVNKNNYIKAHQTSARYTDSVSEFDACSINKEQNKDFPHAPFVRDSFVKIGMKMVKTVKIELNDTVLIIGEIKYISIDEDIVSPSGYLDIEKLGSVCVSGLDSYHTTKRLSRLSYAKPDKEPSEIGECN